MPFCMLKPSFYRLPIRFLPRSILPNITCTSVVRKNSPNATLVLFCSLSRRRHSCQAVQKDIHPHDVESCKGGVSSVENNVVDGQCSVQDNTRKQTDHWNKGRVPWNKGRKHSKETRVRISQRTKEALQDPKVKRKMSETPRALLSNQTKEKIRTSVAKQWVKRLKTKRRRDRFLQTWAESIGNAAKDGGLDQQELEWDSYKKIKREMAIVKIRLAAEKAEVKRALIAQRRRAAQLKAEKRALVAQERREREQNVGETMMRKKKSKEEKEKLAELQEVKLKERLLKIHRKKSTINRVSNPQQRRWDKFNIDFSKVEIPLADQIRYAKENRGTVNKLRKNHILHVSVPEHNV